MPPPSLYISGEGAQAWRITRAASYGAVIGALAAVFKTLASLHEATTVSGNATAGFAANIPEIAGATVAFALLCAGAAALRNLIARRLTEDARDG
jgi:hypothetical protein